MTESTDWQTVRSKHERLSDDEERVLDLLAEGRNQTEIAKLLGLHRSKIWRVAQRLRKLVAS